MLQRRLALNEEAGTPKPELATFCLHIWRRGVAGDGAKQGCGGVSQLRKSTEDTRKHGLKGISGLPKDCILGVPDLGDSVCCKLTRCEAPTVPWVDRSSAEIT